MVLGTRKMHIPNGKEIDAGLRRGTDVDSAVAAVRETAESRPYLWANLIMIDEAGATAVKVRGDRVEATALAGSTARPHHSEACVRRARSVASVARRTAIPG